MSDFLISQLQLLFITTSNNIIFTVKTTPFFPILKEPNPFLLPSTTLIDLTPLSSSPLSSLPRHNSNLVERVDDSPFVLFNIPNIRKGDGHLILPPDYRSELEDKAVVMLNVHLNLYVFLIFGFFFPPFILIYLLVTISIASRWFLN